MGDDFRIHAIILTKDRPETLSRCLASAVASLSALDAVTILDDSCRVASDAVKHMAFRAAADARAHIAHLRTGQLFDVVAQAVDGRGISWQTKCAARDIAPLRNLELLLSAACKGQTTVLIDDDVHSFDLQRTHEYATLAAPVDNGSIVGAAIGGMTEQDTVTRLADAMNVLKSTPKAPIIELFRAPAVEAHQLGAPCGWVSAGYLTFDLPLEQLFAFPPGYNEDWLWCLLQGATGRTRIMRSTQIVDHAPPVVRRSSPDDIHFELRGDFVFDCLARQVNGVARSPDIVLQSLQGHAPDQSLLPVTRAEELLSQHRDLRGGLNHACGLETLDKYGLGLLRDMLHSGDLALDGRRVLIEWCADAIEKQRAFTATVRDSAVQRGVWRAMREGRQ